MTAVLPVCNSWEDQLWAYVNALCEAHTERCLLESAQGKFWTKRVAANAPDLSTPVGLQVDHTVEGLKSTIEDVFTRLATSDKADVRAASATILREVQRHLILGTVPELLDQFCAILEASADSMDEEWVPLALKVKFGTDTA